MFDLVCEAVKVVLRADVPTSAEQLPLAVRAVLELAAREAVADTLAVLKADGSISVTVEDESGVRAGMVVGSAEFMAE